MTLIERIKAVFALAQPIIDMINLLESVFPQSGMGQQKLEVIKSVILTANDTAEDAIPQAESLWETISSFVAAIVSLKNKTK